MSRTDAHAPAHVRIARGDLSAQPWHASRHDACDLPDRVATLRHSWRTTDCFWAFCYTGVSECSCPTCHGGWSARSRNRAGRHHDRAALAMALDAWRGGDAAAFDALVPSGRYPRVTRW